MGRRTPTPEDAKKRAGAEALYRDPSNGLTQLEIAERFGMSLGWLQNLARRGDWPARPHLRNRQVGGVREIDRKLYGDLAEDIVFLRDRCGLHVARFHGQYRIGTDVVSAEGVAARAAEFRKRMGIAPATAAAKPAPRAAAAPAPKDAAPAKPPAPAAASRAPWSGRDAVDLPGGFIAELAAIRDQAQALFVRIDAHVAAVVRPSSAPRAGRPVRTEGAK